MTLAQSLSGPGLWLRTGPLVCCIRSRLPLVAQAIAALYADHERLPEGGFADFHVAVNRARGVRGWLRPQVEFSFDGQRPFLPLPLAQAFAMLEWGLNWCVATHCHQYLVMHAASLEKSGAAVVMPAPPGSGKSTLCAALMLSGWRLLSDELTLIDRSDGRLHALARPVNLKNASLDVIARHFPQATFGPVVPDTQKGTVGHLKPSRLSARRAGEPALPRWVVYPRYRPGAALTVTPIGQAHSFMTFGENAFNYSTLGAAGFETVARLIDHTRSMSLTYGRLEEALAFFDSLAAELTS